MDIVLNTQFNNPNLPIAQIPGFSDDFNRAAAETLGVTSREGRPWQNFDIGSRPSVWGTNGDGTASMLTAGSSWQLVGVDGLVADGVLTATIATIGGDTSRWGGLGFRILDGDNHLRVSELSSTNPRIVLQAREGGSTATLATSTTDMTPGDTVSVAFRGSQIDVFHNGTNIISTTDSTLLEQTVHGFYAQSAAVFSWEHIEFTP